MIRKTFELKTSVADQNDVLAAILDLIDMPYENETLQWSIIDTGFNRYLEVGDEYAVRLYECDLEYIKKDLNISMETILDALNEVADLTFESVDDLDRDLFLKYE